MCLWLKGLEWRGPLAWEGVGASPTRSCQPPPAGLRRAGRAAGSFQQQEGGPCTEGMWSSAALVSSFPLSVVVGAFQCLKAVSVAPVGRGPN